jgi:transposase-like protein
MTNHIDSDLLNTVLQLLTSEGSSGFAEGLRLLVDEAMVQERSAVLQTRPYERCDGRLGRVNGFKPKTLATRVGLIQFRIPQVRDGVDFYPSALEKGIRSERALMLSLAEVYVQGVSTRKVTKIVEELCGHSVSSTQVSTAAAKLDAELQSWRDRPLGSCSYMVLDARYEKIRQGGQLLDCAVLIAIGIGPDGKRSVLGVSAALSEAEAHWRSFLASLQSRGLHGLTFIVSDAHPPASQQALGLWQRLILQQNLGRLAHILVTTATEVGDEDGLFRHRWGDFDDMGDGVGCFEGGDDAFDFS